MKRTTEGRLLTLTIDDLNSEGQGVARSGRDVYFVPGASNEGHSENHSAGAENTRGEIAVSAVTNDHHQSGMIERLLQG